MDGYLSEKELNDFQKSVFKIELKNQHIKALKEVIRSEIKVGERSLDQRKDDKILIKHS
jgi:CRISPR/Cas system-associated endoribonuclease Cas2